MRSIENCSAVQIYSAIWRDLRLGMGNPAAKMPIAPHSSEKKSKNKHPTNTLLPRPKQHEQQELYEFGRVSTEQGRRFRQDGYICALISVTVLNDPYFNKNIQLGNGNRISIQLENQAATR